MLSLFLFFESSMPIVNGAIRFATGTLPRIANQVAGKAINYSIRNPIKTGLVSDIAGTDIVKKGHNIGVDDIGRNIANARNDFIGNNIEKGQSYLRAHGISNDAVEPF